MSPRALRLLLVLCGLYAVAVRTVAPLWGIPFGRSHRELPFVVVYTLTGLGPILLAALPLPVYGWLLWRSRPRATFTLRDGGFEAPAAAGNLLSAVVVIAMMSSPGLLMVEGVPDRAEARFVTDPVSLLLSLVVNALVFGVMAAYLILSGRPRVRLTPAGLTVRTLRRREYAWGDFVAGRPLPMVPERGWVLRFSLRRVNQYGVLWTATVPAYLFHVRPEFLAAAIREYADHPEHRAAIGTPEELARLQRASTAPRIGVTLPS
ncbi:PH domain-containing protein [Hamadaea tsunoensis]|uniref:PH domain-containing protein n=1 Tax=Hamadaea tsunoensis TaxID=53368 RepID=UPI0012F91A05|nr:PH domain-containing protein [Hamadaea tsunoensis]